MAGLVEENVKLCILEAQTHEVVVAIVAKVNRDEIVFWAEMLQKRWARKIFWVAVSITPDVNWTIIGDSNFIEEDIKIGERSYKIWVFALGW